MTQNALKYPKETAGRVMTSAVPMVSERMHAGEVLALVRTRVAEFESVNYVYIVNASHVLVGVVSLKELMTLGDADTLHAYTTRPLVSVHPYTDQERVATLALAHNIKAVPVVAKTHEFLGVVQSDVLLSILNHEHTEDVMRFAGVSHEAPDARLLLHTSILTHIRARLPWLVIGLLGGMLAATVVGFFEGTLAEQLVLAAFIPVIVYIADAVGSQTQMLFIRALTIDAHLRVHTYFLRELLVNAVLASILAVLMFAVSYAWRASLVVSGVVSVSIFLTVCIAVLVAIMVPWVLHRRGLDPAVASGPLATVFRDVTSLSVYLCIASLAFM
jgi:magnesium transporter